MNKRFLYAHLNPNSACDWHRIRLPFFNLEADCPDVDVDISMGDPVGDYRYYLSHGIPLPQYLPEIGRWKRGGGKWVLSLDDDYDTIPESNPAKLGEDGLNYYAVAKDLADVIVVSTPALAAAVNRPAKTLVARNLMPVAEYRTTTPAPDDGRPLRVLWAGTKTHYDDLKLIEAPVEELLKKWRGRVEFVFVGCVPNALLKRWVNNGVYYQPSVELGQYPKLLANIRPHVCLAPLADCVFNRSKSNIRVLESWSLAAAVVASPVGEYAVVRDGVDGLVAATGSDWFTAVDKLLGDGDLRTRLAAAGRVRVGREWDWANRECRGEWRNLVSELLQRSEAK